MFKVSISNSRENKLWEAKFASEELAQAWLAQQIGKPFRLPEREVAIASDYLQEDVLEVISEDIDGVPTQTKVRLVAEYTAIITDITAAYDLDQAQIAARKLLADTDFYIIRFADSGAAIPAGVQAARQAAREIL